MKHRKIVKPISNLEKSTAELIKQINDSQDSIVIKQNLLTKEIFIDITNYEQDIKIFSLLKMLSQSRQAYRNGHYKNVKTSFYDIRKNINKRTQ